MQPVTDIGSLGSICSLDSLGSHSLHGASVERSVEVGRGGWCGWRVGSGKGRGRLGQFKGMCDCRILVVAIQKNRLGTLQGVWVDWGRVRDTCGVYRPPMLGGILRILRRRIMRCCAGLLVVQNSRIYGA